MLPDELTLIWQQHKIRLFSYIRKRVESREIAEDILQEVFIKFWEDHPGIKDSNKVPNWLMGVARHTVADHFRELQKRVSENNCNCIEIDPVKDPEQTVSDESKKLIPIILSLKPEYRNILILSDIHGIPHKVIAENMNLSVACIRQRVVRGRKLIAEKMKCCCQFTHDAYGNIVNCVEKPEYRELLKNLKKDDLKLSLI